jgi:hypothetical protein
MASRTFLAFATAAAATVGANAQYSFMSSTSWVTGEDGQMHKKTHEVTKETKETRDGVMVQSRTSEVICIDGRCKEKDVVSMRPQQQEANMPSPHFLPPHAFLRGSLRDILMGSGHFNAPPPPPKEELIILGMPGNDDHEEELVLVGAPWRLRGPQVVQRLPPVQMKAAPRPAQDLAIIDGGVTTSIALAAAALSVLLAALFGAWCARGSSAREVSLTTRELAQPLACEGTLAATLAPLPVKAAAGPTMMKEEDMVPFSRKPSVGTWLSQRLPEADEEA